MEQTKVTVLIVDDEEDIRETLKDILEKEGYAVKCAKSSVEALDLLIKEHFDILLVDYHMQGKDGIALIRGAYQFSSEYISIVITGSSSLEIAVEAMKAGAQAFLVKPVDIDELKKIIVKNLEEREKFRAGKAKFQEIVKTINISDNEEIIQIIGLQDVTDDDIEEKPEPEPEPESKPKSETELEIKPEPASEVEPKFESEPEQESNPESVPEFEIKPEPESEVEPKHESEPEPGPKLKSESELESVPEYEIKPESISEFDIKPGSESEAEPKLGAEPEPESKPESDPELEIKPEPEIKDEHEPEGEKKTEG